MITTRASMNLMLLSALVMVAGCTHAQEYASTFDPNEVVWSKGSGSGEIIGTAFSTGKDRSGQDVKVTCSGGLITLLPRSKRADEETLAFYGSLDGGSYEVGTKDGFKTNGDPRMMSSARTALCSPDGQFSFSGLPDGQYYLSALIYQNGSNRVKAAGSESIAIHADQRAVGIAKRIQIAARSRVVVELSAPFPLHQGEYLKAY